MELTKVVREVRIKAENIRMQALAIITGKGNKALQGFSNIKKLYFSLENLQPLIFLISKL
jgi:hypothetical protein